MAGSPHLAAFGGMCSHWDVYLPPADKSLARWRIYLLPFLLPCLCLTDSMLPNGKYLVFDACVEVGVELFFRRNGAAHGLFHVRR